MIRKWELHERADNSRKLREDGETDRKRRIH